MSTEITHVRRGNLITTLASGEVTKFESINAAKKFVRESLPPGTVRVETNKVAERRWMSMAELRRNASQRA